MQSKMIGIILMIAAIFVMGIQIGITAKTESSDYFFLLPVGIALLLVGMLLVFRGGVKGKE
jgi:nitrogen fixation/metabolism regulation signal transduction histidine kinase